MPSFASFFTIVFDYVFVIQMLTVSLAAAYVLTPPDLGGGVFGANAREEPGAVHA